ncbi:MAG: oxidoreductase [Burkholderiales bacterium]
MENFKAFRIFNEDGKIASRMTRMTIDELDQGEIVIQAEYSSVNYKDGLAATGAGKICRKFPINGGIDVAGTVLTSSNTKFKVGDKVLVTGYDLGVAHDGGYAQLVRVPADWVVPMPTGMTPLEAMTIGTAGFTAALSVVQLERNGMKPGNGKVIVTGASGGVGSVAVEILAGLGYDVTVVTGKDSGHEFLRQLGAKNIVSRHTLEMGTKPMEKNLWAGAVDPVGGATTAWLTRTMNYGASIAVSGLTGGTEINTTVLPFILRGVNLLGIDSVMCPMAARLEVWRRLSTDMKLRHATAIAHVIDFEQLPETFATILKGGVTGRTVLRIA